MSKRAHVIIVKVHMSNKNGQKKGISQLNVSLFLSSLIYKGITGF